MLSGCVVCCAASADSEGSWKEHVLLLLGRGQSAHLSGS